MGEGGSAKYTYTCYLCKGVCEGYTSTDIALEVRWYAFRCDPFYEKRHAADNVYGNILKKIRSYHNECTSGKYTKLLELYGSDRMKATRGELVYLRSRRQKLVSEVNGVETDLLEYLEDCWAKEKRVTRNIIFWMVIELDPNFLSSVGSDNHMAKLNK